MNTRTQATKTARFVARFNAMRWQSIGEAVLQSIDARIGRGETANDTPAPPLKAPTRDENAEDQKAEDRRFRRAEVRSYPRRKQRKGLAVIRDWFYSGILRRNIKVLKTFGNGVAIGPVPGASHNPTGATKGVPLTVDQVLTLNQRRSRQWGISPRDSVVLARELSKPENQPIRVEQKHG
jgi:hypothetical protein